MKRLLSALAAALLGPYEIYRVGRVCPVEIVPLPAGFSLREVTAAELAAAPETELQESSWYLGSEALAYGCFDGERLLGLACCWWGARYRQRLSWPIGEQAAKLVHLVTVPAARGRRVAPLLIQHAEASLRAQGRSPLFARVWHSNTPSLRAFERAGWELIGTLLVINPLRRESAWRLRLPF